jgi:hypothetical protein
VDEARMKTADDAKLADLKAAMEPSWQGRISM